MTAAEARQRGLAHAAVMLVDTPAEEPAHLREQYVRSAASSDGSDGRYDAVSVRVYNQGRHRSVRDPRTNVHHTDVVAVLRDGQIDPFLLGISRQSAEAMVTDTLLVAPD